MSTIGFDKLGRNIYKTYVCLSDITLNIHGRIGARNFITISIKNNKWREEVKKVLFEYLIEDWISIGYCLLEF